MGAPESFPAGKHTRQATSPSQDTHTRHSHLIRVSGQPYVLIFRQGNPKTWRKNMQTQHKKTLRGNYTQRIADHCITGQLTNTYTLNGFHIHLRPGWTCPSKAVLQTTSLPTWQCRSSTHRWPRWTSCKRWPQAPSTSLESSHPEGGRKRQMSRKEIRVQVSCLVQFNVTIPDSSLSAVIFQINLMATGLNDGNGLYSHLCFAKSRVFFCLSDTITLYSTKCINPARGAHSSDAARVTAVPPNTVCPSHVHQYHIYRLPSPRLCLNKVRWSRGLCL